MEGCGADARPPRGSLAGPGRRPYRTFDGQSILAKVQLVEISASQCFLCEGLIVWLEAGDWFVWQLVGARSAGGDVSADRLTRSTCQAGYKALWSESTGYPGADYLDAVHPELALTVAEKLPGVFVAPGRVAGALCPAMAERLGLDAGIPVSAAIIDAHAGVPGAGVGRAGTLVMVMGTSGCDMLLSEVDRPVAGVAGIVPDGILPGFVGYETGQAAMGDAFDLARRLTGGDFQSLERAASEIAPGSDGVLCLDWFNGCRTPIMEGALRGAFCGLSLDHELSFLIKSYVSIMNTCLFCEDIAKAIQLAIEYAPEPPFDAGRYRDAPPERVEMVRSTLNRP